MWLSRIELAPGAAGGEAFWRQVRSGYSVHQLVWSWFAGDPEASRDFLYRYEQGEGAGRFYVLSAREPRAADGLWRVESKPFAPKLAEGARLGFSLRANPTVRRNEGQGAGKRHDVVMDGVWRAREQTAAGAKPPDKQIDEPCLQWLAARAERCGFAIEPGEVRVEGYRQERVGGHGKRGIRLSVVDFEGLLTVRDPKALVAALETGIGPAKGFGCGLMLVKRG